MEQKNVTSINTNILLPHPNNPRKDLGDLTELTKSIKKNGIMQNLTVIPNGEKYTVLIGHRRLAAAKAAGIKEMPCRIVENMSDKEQLAMMLEENMQRNDLTVPEQAQGFQMMLDLGSTEEEISKKTGFSKATVHHRLELAKLDPQELAKKQNDIEFQLSLVDLYELERIDDIKERNRILNEAKNTSMLKNDVTRYLREAKEEKKVKEIIAILESKGVASLPEELNEYSRGYMQLMCIFCYEEKPSNFDFKKVPPNKCFYFVRYNSVYILCKIADYPKVPKSKEELKYENEKKQMAKLKKLDCNMKLGWADLIKNVINGNVVIEDNASQLEIIEQAIKIAICSNGCIDASCCAAVYYNKDSYNVKGEELDKIKGLDLINLALLMMLAGVKNRDLCDFYGRYQPKAAEQYKQVIDLLKHYSYKLTPEQQQLMDGTHKLFIKPEENDEHNE